MKRVGDWICTYTGIRFWPLDPQPEEVCIEDIAHSLSLQCRFAGHTRVFYSVADHSLHVSNLCRDRFWGLMHDSPEAYLVDLPRPLKRHSMLGVEYKKIECRLTDVIAERFGLHVPMPIDVHEADNFVLAWEKRDLVHENSYKLCEDEQGTQLPTHKLAPRTAELAEKEFLEKFFDLGGRR